MPAATEHGDGCCSHTLQLTVDCVLRAAQAASGEGSRGGHLQAPPQVLAWRRSHPAHLTMETLRFCFASPAEGASGAAAARTTSAGLRTEGAVGLAAVATRIEFSDCR